MGSTCSKVRVSNSIWRALFRRNNRIVWPSFTQANCRQRTAAVGNKMGRWLAERQMEPKKKTEAYSLGTSYPLGTTPYPFPLDLQNKSTACRSSILPIRRDEEVAARDLAVVEQQQEVDLLGNRFNIRVAAAAVLPVPWELGNQWNPRCSKLRLVTTHSKLSSSNCSQDSSNCNEDHHHSRDTDPRRGTTIPTRHNSSNSSSSNRPIRVDRGSQPGMRRPICGEESFTRLREELRRRRRVPLRAVLLPKSNRPRRHRQQLLLPQYSRPCRVSRNPW